MRSGKAKTQTGVALVEAALTLLLLFIFLFGIMEMGRFFNVQQTLTDAAREGARLAVTPLTQTSTLPTTAEITDRAMVFVDSASIRNATVLVTRPVTFAGSATQYTRVRVEAPYQILTLSMFSALQITLKGESLMRNETSP